MSQTETKEIPEFIKRLINERDELQTKYNGNFNFQNTENFKSVSENQRVLLKVQLKQQKALLDTLNERLTDLGYW